MTYTTATAAKDTLQARRWEQQATSFMQALEEARPEAAWPTDLEMLARLTWMEAGRALERLCERDGISRWNYRWPS